MSKQDQRRRRILGRIRALNARDLEIILFGRPGLALTTRIEFVNQLFLDGTDEAFRVLTRIVRAPVEKMDVELKRTAAKILLCLNSKKAWEILGISGPAWLDPLTVVTAGNFDTLNGPGHIGGLPEVLFDEIARVMDEPDYGRASEEDA